MELDLTKFSYLMSYVVIYILLIFSLHRITSNKFRARIGVILKKYMGQNMWVENSNFQMCTLIKNVFKAALRAL